MVTNVVNRVLLGHRSDSGILYVVLCLCMAVCGYVWLCVAVCGCVRHYMWWYVVIYSGKQLYGPVWLYVVEYGCMWLFMAVCCCIWV